MLRCCGRNSFLSAPWSTLEAIFFELAYELQPSFIFFYLNELQQFTLSFASNSQLLGCHDSWIQISNQFQVVHPEFIVTASLIPPVKSFPITTKPWTEEKIIDLKILVAKMREVIEEVKEKYGKGLDHVEEEQKQNEMCEMLKKDNRNIDM